MTIRDFFKIIMFPFISIIGVIGSSYIIKYLILDKYKRDDFDFINKYEFSKECFYNKFEGK